VQHEAGQTSRPQGGALPALQAFVAEARGRVPEDFGDFEKQLHARVMAVERELVGEALAQADMDVEAVSIEGCVYRRVLRCEDTYLTAAGPVRVTRTLYRAAGGGERCVCPLEVRLGLVEGRWTPLAAEQAAWVVAQLTPACAEECFERLGNQTPSRASLDRLPKALGARWEAGRAGFEAAVRAEEAVPQEAKSVAMSLDGILTPMRECERAHKREAQAAQGLLQRGAAGYREVGCATLSFFDAEGDFLRAVRLGRMPEEKKRGLKALLQQELAHVLQQRPDLTLVKLADGAHDNWDFLADAGLPKGVETVDFFHAAEHLSAALGAAHGEGSVRTRNRFDTLRRTLLEVPGGVAKVIAALARLAKAHPHAPQVRKALNYFRTHRARMDYATSHAAHLPVGSGCVEAACKSLVTRRLKGGGMRWGMDGGQAILTLRSLQQSDRFDAAWALLAATYKLEVTTLANVVALRSSV
jgi:hypothetical protein